MKELQEFSETLRRLKEDLRFERSLPSALHDRLVAALQELVDAKGKVEKASELDEEKVKTQYHRSLAFSRIVSNLKAQQGRFAIPPSYLYDVAPSLTEPPYTIPKTLSEPEGAERISIKARGKVMSERAELALALLFPGSTTYRYGGGPVKVRTGPWFQAGRASLSDVHVLSPETEFDIDIDGRKRHVRRPITLHTIPIARRPFVCRFCLSISDNDETCNHRGSIPMKLPSSYPVLIKKELRREIGETISFRLPLSRIVTEASFLDFLEIGVAARGFERTVSLRGGQTTISVDFDPPIGFKLATTGISFKITPLEELAPRLAEDRMFGRDVIIQLLSSRLRDALRSAELPPYHHEPVLSSLVNALGLDSTVDLDTINATMSDERFAERVLQEAAREQTLYESTPIDATRLTQAIHEVAESEISQDDVKLHTSSAVMHTLAHSILLACAVTSGSQLEDLDYIVGEDEVVIFDSASGGNGSCAMCFQFLSTSGSFSLKEYLGSEEWKEIHRPRNFDETLFELLLPCLNGVSDRSFFFGHVLPREAETRRKIIELEEKENTHRRAVERFREYGLESAYPTSIGFHAVDYSTDPSDADRFKEVASICLHGCPECISLGSKCVAGSFRERYSVSKYALDRLLLMRMQPFIVNNLDKAGILERLGQDGLAILRVLCQSSEDYDDVTDGAMELILDIAGQNVDGKYVKFAGHWADLDYDTSGLAYYYLLAVV